MLPQRKTPPADGSDGRKGFEVRVIGGGGPLSAEPRASGPLAESGIVIGGRGPRETSAADPDEAPVRRLEVDQDGDHLQVKSTAEVEPAAAAGESSRHRGKKRRGLQHWTLWMAAACVGITVLAVAGLMLQKKSNALDPSAAPAVEEQAPAPPTAAEVERDFFVAHANELSSEAEEILRRYAAAASMEEVLPLVRDPERVRGALEAKWKPWGVEPSFAPSAMISGGVDVTGIRPHVALTGSKGDHSRFDAFFVREKGKMLLDWEATAGIGDLQIPELKSGARAENSVVRALLYPSDYFTSEHPEGKFNSYKLTDASGEHVVWAYVPVDSPVAGLLKAELNEDSYLIQRSTNLAGVFKLEGPVSADGNRYLITEMLHKGWVSP